MTKNRVATALAALAALAAATAAPAALTAPTAAPRLSPVKSKQQFRARPTHSRPRQLADPVLVTTSRVCHKKIAAKPPGFAGLELSPLFTHTGSGDTTRPGHVANDYNPPVPPQADPAPRPDGEDVTLDSDL